ncbi:cell division protein FtsA [Paucilactobacillus oligofermentans DSM 15707 = LMG 22743]|uniref:Cell division protein FtsA n=1 Tax=Paucilactobacillus oligofermentans DSM 15707 = LMG 22743 TaxID=1423778 RepID=A0A0R1RMK2_9LACO|nr:cell division protein FtsA [Paucilactobacillus oligofermentans]KRL54600.1 cell division protein FtsA [Paucilactobacillus oligofermentans DSM 15707 = LMG 22743]CUS26491.1 Cell division ATP-binding protein FtsA [Paucilactobacillus oligofermentans DSM 15707 = LMG 22743]
MNNSGIYVGLDIGTTSIKAIVCENVKGQLNVVGVGSEQSAGLNRGIIVDIDKTAVAIKKAVDQAQEKSNVTIDEVVVGIPANFLKIEKSRGMITIANQSQAREINDQDVIDVAKETVMQSLPPEREIIDLKADEFIVDGFNDIKDPRGMVGVRLELHATLYTGPKTVVHNTKKALEKAGIKVKDLVVSPLAIGDTILNDGEKDFGTVVIDIGGGQSTTSVIHDHQLKYSFIDPEGGQYITKDISVVLNTSLASAERIKRDYGYANSDTVSEVNTFTVDVVGQSKPVEFTEQYLAEIIQARVEQIFERINQKLQSIKALDLPGGIVITGGVAALPGITDLAEQYFGIHVRAYVPDQMGIRHPSFTQGFSLTKFEANLNEVDLLVKRALRDNEAIQSHDDESHSGSFRDSIKSSRIDTQKRRAHQNAPEQQRAQSKPKDKKEKTDRLTGVKNFFNDFFN